MNSRLFIVIVNWNLKTDTSDCIRSLVKAGADLAQIILIDNGSTDGSAGFLRKSYFDKLQIIELDKNIGFAGATNIGIRAAMKQDAEWLLLINNDTCVAVDFFEHLLNAIESQPEYSVFGPAIYYAENPDVLWFLGEWLIPCSMLTVNRYRGRSMPDNLPPILPVDFLSGCAMLIKRTALERTGLLDENLFMYGEEVDWFWRARRTGQRFAAVSRASMWHKVSASSINTPSKTQCLRIRNQIWGYRRYGNYIQIVFLFIFTFFRVALISLRGLISGKKGLWKSSWDGWVDGWGKSLPIKSDTDNYLWGS